MKNVLVVVVVVTIVVMVVIGAISGLLMTAPSMPMPDFSQMPR